jgi:2-polyprenyl-3-methyl-5-hydroxy-6-metoxy-1,4-benzoquinol methylase
LKRVLKRGLALPLRLLPAAARRQLVRVGFEAASRGRPSAALRELLQLDADLSRVIDEAAQAYDDGIHAKHRLTAYHDFFVERIKAGEQVLDLGCGHGAVSYAIAVRAGAMVTGVDLSEENVRIARARFSHPGLCFEVRDATRDIPRHRVDVIVASNVLEHVERRVELLRAVQAAAQPTRWLIRVPMIDRDWRVPLRSELGLFAFSDPTHVTEYTRASFETELAAAGLTITQLQINWGELWAEARPGA